MDNKLINFKNNKVKIANLILAVIVFLQVINLIYCFGYLKKGFHSDESFSYGLANSYYQPFINTSTHNGSDVLNKNQWLSGEVINNYFSVQKDQRFAYDSVYYNNTKDVHPPFYYFVLHTVCSLFPDTFSWWYGFSINVVLFILTQIFLFKLVKKLTNDNLFLSVLICAFYGFCQSGIDTFIFIRMYAMITFFAVLSAYLHVCLLQGGQDNKRIIEIGILTFIGGFTHYYFLVFECALSACVCVYFLCKKKYRNMIFYAMAQLFGAILVIVLYPSIFDHLAIFSGDPTKDSDYHGFFIEMRFYISYLWREVFGIKTEVKASYFLINIAEAVFWILIIAGPIGFLLRNEKCLKKIINKIIGILKTEINYLYNNVSILVFFLFIAYNAVLIAIGKTATILDFGITTVRYMFIAFPFIYLCLFILVYNVVMGLVINVFNKEKANRYINCAMFFLMGILCLNINISSDKPFYYDYGQERTVDISELDKNAQYILVLPGNWTINFVGSSLFGIDSFFYTTESDFAAGINELKLLEKNKKTYFIIARSNLKDIVEQGQNYTLDEIISMENESQSVDSIVNEKYIKKYFDYLKENEVMDSYTWIGQDVLYGRYFLVYEIR